MTFDGAYSRIFCYHTVHFFNDNNQNSKVGSRRDKAFESQHLISLATAVQSLSKVGPIVNRWRWLTLDDHVGLSTITSNNMLMLLMIQYSGTSRYETLYIRTFHYTKRSAGKLSALNTKNFSGYERYRAQKSLKFAP